MIVGTAGHIDHGKTSLVKALTGVDTDRLKEEKARGITIELGFAYWPRASGQTIGFVDVPGHERLVRTMLAGATGIDFILLAIAADDGVMPQTREHLAIIDLLQIPRGLVVLTKADTVSKARLGEIGGQVRAVLAGTVLADAPIIPASVRSGEGLAELTQALDEALAQTGVRSAAQAFRMGIDRVFSLAGAGTVVTGTVISGTVRVGDQVVVSPSGVPARVRSIHALNKPSDSGSAGQRCALALTGPDVSIDNVPRGELVVAPHLHAPANRIDARLTVLASETRPLGQWLPVRVHFAATEALGHLVVLRDAPLRPGDTDYVQLVLDKPVAAAAGDRFVLRDTGALRTIGGGRFIDLRAPARHRRTRERRAELDARESTEPIEALKRLVAIDPRPIDLGAFVRDHAAAAGEAETAIKALALVPLRVKARTLVVGAERWQVLRGSILKALAVEGDPNAGAGHGAGKSDAPGMEIERLRRAAAQRFSKDAFAAALGKLRDDGALVLEGGRARLPLQQRREVSGEQLLWERIKRHISECKNFTPPRVRDIAGAERLSEDMVRRLCKSAAKRSEVREVAADQYYMAESVIELAAITRALAGSKPDGRFTVAEFRDRLGCGRKVAMHILEFFDKQNLTMHREDWRRLNPHGEALFRAANPAP